MNARTRKKLDKAIHELTEQLETMPDDDAVWCAQTTVEIQKLLREAYNLGYERGYADGQ
jgi:hypothetical protein